VATVTDRLLETIDFDAMRQISAFSDSVVKSAERSLYILTAGYERLAKSIQTITDVTDLPSFALTGAARELFIGGYTTKKICISGESNADKPDEAQLVSETEEVTSGCLNLIRGINPALVRPYVGAHDALKNNNADRTRHFLSSLRELWNHLLRHLAPDELVIKWVSGIKDELLHQGRPTRKARVLYICRNLNHEPLSDFVIQDTQALIKLVELFNRVHELEPRMTDSQLKALLLRTESWIMYLLKIEETSK
jgi:hypothetical protein